MFQLGPRRAFRGEVEEVGAGLSESAMTWMKSHSKDKSCKSLTICKKPCEKTRSPFGRRLFVYLCFLAYCSVGSISARADLTLEQMTLAVQQGVVGALSTAPVSFNSGAVNSVPWLYPSFQGLTLGEYLIYSAGFSPSVDNTVTLRSLLEDIQSSISSNPSLNLSDLQSLFALYLSSENVSAAHMIRPQYEFFYDLQGWDDDIGYFVATYFSAQPDWASFFSTVLTASQYASAFYQEVPGLIDNSLSDGLAWRAVLTSGQMGTFESWKDDVVDAIQESDVTVEGLVDSFSHASGVVTNLMNDINLEISTWRQDFLDYVATVTDTSLFSSEAQDVDNHVQAQVDQAQNDAKNAMDQITYESQVAMNEQNDPQFTSDIISNPYDSLQGLYDQVSSKVADKVPSSSDYSFSPKMTLLYENQEVWGRGVNKIEIDLSKPQEWAPGIGADFNQKVTTVMKWLWELVVDVSTIAIVLRYIGKIHENMV